MVSIPSLLYRLINGTRNQVFFNNVNFIFSLLTKLQLHILNIRPTFVFPKMPPKTATNAKSAAPAVDDFPSYFASVNNLPNLNQRRNELLAYTWMLCPNTERADLVHVTAFQKRQVYESFLEAFDDTELIKIVFRAWSTVVQRTWMKENDSSKYPKDAARPYDVETYIAAGGQKTTEPHSMITPDGAGWIRAFMTATLRLRIGVEDKRTRNMEKIQTDVKIWIENFVYKRELNHTEAHIFQRACKNFCDVHKDRSFLTCFSIPPEKHADCVL